MAALAMSFITACRTLTEAPISDAYRRRIQASHAELGIAPDYAASRGLPVCPEPARLVNTEPDCFNRPQRLAPQAAAAWGAMREAAAAEGVTIHLISAFRSLQYQHELIAAKLARGQALAEVLKVNAAPGFSEHHTGRAVDVGTDECSPLEQSFEETEAFRWLSRRGGEFGFTLSYPPDNEFGIIYEPWHWRFSR